LSEIGKLGSGKPENEYMERVMKEGHVIYGAWLKTYRPTKPVILAAEGFARAGGTEILQGTDIRVAGESAMFGVTEVQRGLEVCLRGQVVDRVEALRDHEQVLAAFARA